METQTGTLAFVALFFFLLSMQAIAPLRRWVLPKLQHLVTNIGVAIAAGAAAQLAVVPIGVAVTRWAARDSFGLFHWVRLPEWLTLAAGFVLLDFTFYYWHRLNHVVPFLWRFHNVHHIDADLDVSTSLRFHFGEIALSTAFRVVQLALLGVPTSLYLVFEVCFGAAAQFHHSNWRLPYGVEAVLNRFIVTPRMHGIHHSIVQHETNSNYSTIFSWWDRIHGSFHGIERHEGVTIGVPAYRDAGDQTFLAALALPLRKQRDYWA